MRLAAGLARQVPGQPDVAVAEGRVADQFFKRALGVVIDKAAVGVEVHGREPARTRRDGRLSARSRVLILRRDGIALNVDIAAQVATPAGVGAGGKAGELAKLGVAPFHVELNGHLT